MPEHADLQPIGSVIGVEGVATAVRGEFTRELTVGSAVYEGEVIKTASDSNVEVRFADDTLLAQGPNAELSLDDYVYDDDKDLSHLLFEASVGAFRITTGVITEMNPEGFQIGGPLSTLGIRGTIVTMDVKEDGTTSIGAEELHERFVVVQSDAGQERLIMNSGKVVDIDLQGNFSPIRSYTPEEASLFKSISTQSVLVESQLKEEKEKQEKENQEEGAEEGTEEGVEGEGGEEAAEEAREGKGQEEGEGSEEGEEAEDEEGENEEELEEEQVEEELPEDELPEEGQEELKEERPPEEGPVQEDGGERPPQEPPPGEKEPPVEEGGETTPTEQDPTNEITGEPGQDIVGDSQNEFSEESDSFTSGDESMRLTPESELTETTTNPPTDDGSAPEPTTSSNEPATTTADTPPPPPPPNETTEEEETTTTAPPPPPPPGDGVIYGTSGNDTINGTVGNDTINGLAGDDVINGLDGNDTLIGGLGNNTLDGGLGIDVLDYSAATSALTLYMTAPSATGTGFSDSFSNIESVIGTQYGDMMTGDIGNNTLMGGGGDDTLVGDAGNDVLIGGAGNDNLDGGVTGVDTLDYSSASAGISGILSGTSNGTIDATAAGEGTDVYSNIEHITATAYADTFSMAFSDVNVELGAGNDYATTDGGSDSTLVGGAGTDTLALGGGGSYNLDMVTGQAGGGTFIHFSEFESFTASGSSDTVNFSTSASAVSAVLGTSTNGVSSSYTFENFENLQGSAYNDTLEVGSGQYVNALGGNDILYSRGGANLVGGGGNDTFMGAVGNDTYDGGVGIDYVDYSSFSAGLSATLSGTSGTVNAGAAGTDSLYLVDEVSGTNYADTFNLLGGATAVYALGGNDFISHAGTSTGVVDGGTGTDTLQFGSNVLVDMVGGNATLSGATMTFSDIENVVGASNDDTVSFAAAASGVTIVMSNASNYGLTSDYNVEGFEHVDGSAYADTIEGFTNVDVHGGAGNDLIYSTGGTILYGDAGDDTFMGGVGNDFVNGGLGTDLMDYSSFTGGLSVTLSAGTAEVNAGVNGVDTLIGGEQLKGTSFADIFFVTGSTPSSLEMAFVDGGGGTDTLSLDGGNYYVDIANESMNITSGGGTFTYDNIENVTATGDYDHANFSASTTAVNVVLSNFTYDTTNYTGFENVTGSNYDDTLLQVGQNGNAYAGTGNDWIEVDHASFGYVGGEAGEDTLAFGAGGMTYDLTAGYNVYDIEAINMEDATTNVLTLDYTSVNSATDVDNILLIDGVAGNTINVTGAETWVDDGIVSVDGHNYQQYSYSGTTIQIDTDINSGDITITT